MKHDPDTSCITIFSIALIAGYLNACSSPASSETLPVTPADISMLSKNENRNNSGLYTFQGICDGSAAVKIAADTILVAYDESTSLFAFKFTGGTATARRDLNDLLDLKSAAELDIEAATLDDNRIWWLGSHSRDGKGRYAANRHLLFATNIPAPDLRDLKLIVKPVDLTEILIKSEITKAALPVSAHSLPAKAGGINIEGIAAGSNGQLVIGFRSPLSGDGGLSGEALLVSILPAGDSVEITRLDRLKLGDRGIRDIVRNDGTGFMIIAGAVNTGKPSALYEWNGIEPPQLIQDLDTLNPEGLVNIAKQWLILSDDGKVQRADSEASDGMRSCDRIRSKNRLGEAHPGVFFRAQMIDAPQ